ncbi:Hypothetical protein NTJ_06569 [Nesidiocoris tenuis]|uniref:Uncharacterized protein n=1 Tax=Nesidiocoris tenuis TaxID=355587 RepID=A0ABN7ANF2_9HEMI|nr:Hypothetical protein NTJ_06569 [Nesidiocoris tenuis]
MSAALRKSQTASHPENKVNFIQPSFNEEELSLQIPEDALRKSEAFRHSKSMVISDQNLPEHMDTVSRQSRHSAGSTGGRICHLPSPEYASETPASPKYPLTIVSGSTIELPKMRSTGVGSSEVLAESVLTQTESFSSFSEQKDVPFEMKKHGRIESLKQPRESGESRRTLNEAYRTNERKGL